MTLIHFGISNLWGSLLSGRKQAHYVKLVQLNFFSKMQQNRYLRDLLVVTIFLCYFSGGRYFRKILR